MSLATRFAAWQRRLSAGQAIAVVVLAMVLIGAIALAAALLSPSAAGLAGLLLAALYLVWCARLTRTP